MQEYPAIHKRLGQRIRQLRRDKDMSQEDLAFEAKIDRSYMGFIERGGKNPTLDRIISIAQALKVNLAKLFESV